MPDITLKASDNTGSCGAYLALPEGGKGPGIVVIQEIFGVNGFIRNVCDHYAALGYVALAPDLFWRLAPGVQLNPKVAADHNRAFELYKVFDVAKGIEDLIAAVAYLRENECCTQKVGTVGYCLGGKLAYLMATRSDVDAAVGYYGVGIQDLLGEAAAITKPLLLHMPAEDAYCDAAAREKIQAALGKIPGVALHVYPGADHAFARPGGDNYVADAATLANQRTEALFAEALG